MFLSVSAIVGCVKVSIAGAYYDVVDIYDSATGSWTTAQLSVARMNFAAASVGTMALFGGGTANGSTYGF